MNRRNTGAGSAERRAEVIVLAPYYPPAFRAGGPVRSVSGLVAAGRDRFECHVITRNWDLGDPAPLRGEPNRWLGSDGEHVWAFGHGMLSYVRCLVAFTREDPWLVYVNSLFDPWTSIIPTLVWRVAGSKRSRLMVAPRGQLAAEALNRSARRKQLILAVWRHLVRHSGVVVHAATEVERSDVIEAFGPVDVVVRSNEVGPMSPAPAGPPPSDQLRAVFLGRIVPIKGLLELIQSLRSVTQPIALDVLGPEQDRRYLDDCQRAARQLPVNVTVRFLGPVEHNRVRDRLAQYDLMLNPTRGESFGQAIGECLAAGTPVAVAAVTPWTAWINGANGGRIVLDEGWARVVDEVATMPCRERQALRSGARRAYEDWWREADGQPHVFELVRDLSP